MKKVIALWGKASVGKTTTIKQAYGLLLAKYLSATIVESYLGGDIRVVLTIEGVLIVILSQGDPGTALAGRLDACVTLNAQVIVCATRTRGETVNAVKQLGGGYEVLWIEQTAEARDAEREASNLAMAQQLVVEVEAVIGV